MAKRAYKLQEFVAHTSNVNCLKIGRRSSGVLVTGGDDKKVNMWAIGKPDSIMVGYLKRTPNVWFSSPNFTPEVVLLFRLPGRLSPSPT